MDYLCRFCAVKCVQSYFTYRLQVLLEFEFSPLASSQPLPLLLSHLVSPGLKRFFMSSFFSPFFGFDDLFCSLIWLALDLKSFLCLFLSVFGFDDLICSLIWSVLDLESCLCIFFLFLVLVICFALSYGQPWI